MFIQKWHHFNVSIFRELRSIRLKRHLECLHSLCHRIVMVQKYHLEISWTHLLHHNTTTLYHHNKIYIYNSFHAQCTPATHGNSMLHLRAHGTGPWRALQYWIELHKKTLLYTAFDLPFRVQACTHFIQSGAELQCMLQSTVLHRCTSYITWLKSAAQIHSASVLALELLPFWRAFHCTTLTAQIHSWSAAPVHCSVALRGPSLPRSRAPKHSSSSH